MTELITREQADAQVLFLIGADLVRGPFGGAVASRRRAAVLPAVLVAGGVPVLVGVLWRVYNAITDRMGLDTVANLLVNLAMFVTVGVLCGAGWAWLTVRRPGPEPEVDSGEGPPGPEAATEPPRNP